MWWRRFWRRFWRKFWEIYNEILVILCEQFHFLKFSGLPFIRQKHNRYANIPITILVCLLFTLLFFFSCVTLLFLWIIPLELVCQCNVLGVLWWWCYFFNMMKSLVWVFLWVEMGFGKENSVKWKSSRTPIRTSKHESLSEWGSHKLLNPIFMYFYGSPRKLHLTLLIYHSNLSFQYITQVRALIFFFAYYSAADLT